MLWILRENWISCVVRAKQVPTAGISGLQSSAEFCSWSMTATVDRFSKLAAIVGSQWPESAGALQQWIRSLKLINKAPGSRSSVCKWSPVAVEMSRGCFSFPFPFSPLPLFFTLAESAAFEGLVKPKASRCSIKQIKSVRQAAICPIQ